MTDALQAPSPVEAPEGHRLGDPIALCDLLALPPDGRRYTRDDQGRLALMAPDRASAHSFPRARLLRAMRGLDLRWEVVPDASLAFDPILDLSGSPVPPSALGLRTLEPDLALFDGLPALLPLRPGSRIDVYSPRGLALAIELLSPSTFRSDLGTGSADEVDRWRTYLANGVPEYWVLNADTERLGLPARSGLFLVNDGGRAWSALPVDGAEPVSGAEHAGLVPVRAGLVRSRAVPGLTLDLAAFWRGLESLSPE